MLGVFAVYIQKDVRVGLIEKTTRIRIGNSCSSATSGWGRSSTTRLSKLTSPRLSARRSYGGKILVGGKRVTEPPFYCGYFVEPYHHRRSSA